MSELLPLLSNSFLKDLESIGQIYNCAIAKYLVAANKNQLGITDYCRMIAVRDKIQQDEQDILLSFLPEGKQPVYSEEGVWAKKNRQTGKPAKVAFNLIEGNCPKVEITQYKVSNRWHDHHPGTKILMIQGKPESMMFSTPEYLATLETRVIKREKTRFTAKSYEDFANNIKLYYECRFEFRLVDGDDIEKYYNSSTYYSDKGEKGTLWGSCMRECDEDYFHIYSKNDVKLLLCIYCDQVIGRALVWNTDKGVFMDRIYYYFDYLTGMFIDYARTNKWIYKVSQSSADYEQVMMYDEDEKDYIEKELIMKVDLLHRPDSYPFCDTFRYMYDDNNQMYLHNSDSSMRHYALDSTEGKRNEEDLHICERCNSMTEDSLYVSRYGINVCRSCSTVINGAYELIQDCTIDVYGFYRLTSQVVELFNGQFALAEHTTTDYKGRLYVTNKMKRMYDNRLCAVASEVIAITEGKFRGLYAPIEEVMILKSDDPWGFGNIVKLKD